MPAVTVTVTASQTLWFNVFGKNSFLYIFDGALPEGQATHACLLV